MKTESSPVKYKILKLKNKYGPYARQKNYGIFDTQEEARKKAFELARDTDVRYQVVPVDYVY